MQGILSMAVRFRLADVLAERTMTQTELSRRSGVSIVTVNGIANNRTTRVDLETLDKLCEVLEVEPGELLERETPKRRRGR
ncbi:MAG: helix-turn-helix transcriptional regulator [Gemmatimonadetes bacterium]|mgnify:FL=1|nr:helix-turn-helix transcriptional regulator [Gemmatimonadota bacterium]MBK6455380.1 helix-turn-helix transcriptional regulator [Gemmatimonadota bacterium]MBK8645310.1 helix-turn-helix transcriptional regulator [Gemmatimonadota bacterium]MBK9406598.1 helix-turn-helix transcriptional regulator [Gemmatimonadota bacterium]